ncbi:MAG: hypothetical protein ABIR20_04955 [Lysobacter sp.]
MIKTTLRSAVLLPAVLLVALTGATAVAAAETPIATLTCVVPAAKQGKIAAQLRKFAKDYQFEIELALSPDGRVYSIRAWRDDMLVLGSNAAAAEQFTFEAYPANAATPPAHTMSRRVVRKLRAEISEVAACTL